MSLKGRISKLKRDWKVDLFRKWLALVVDHHRLQSQLDTTKLNLEMVEARVTRLEEQLRGGR